MQDLINTTFRIRLAEKCLISQFVTQFKVPVIKVKQKSIRHVKMNIKENPVEQTSQGTEGKIKTREQKTFWIA